MLFNIVPIETITFIAGLFAGLLIAIFRARHWREQINIHLEKIQSLIKSNKKKDTMIKGLNNSIQEFEANIENLNDELSQSIEDNQDLILQVEEKDQSLVHFKENVRKLDAQIKEINTRAEEAEAKNKELENSLRKTEKDLQNLQSHSQEQESQINQMNNQASQMQDRIQELTALVDNGNQTNKQLQEAVNNRDIQIQEWRNHSEKAQTRILEMETLLKERENNIITLEAKVRAMQDNLTIITGIGPKVSSVLRSAGINTFAQLAALNVNNIKEILVSENPRLLQLVEPSAWPEQAALASAGEWEALKTLQESLKG